MSDWRKMIENTSSPFFCLWVRDVCALRTYIHVAAQYSVRQATPSKRAWEEALRLRSRRHAWESDGACAASQSADTRLQHALQCWGALIRVTTWTVHTCASGEHAFHHQRLLLLLSLRVWTLQFSLHNISPSQNNREDEPEPWRWEIREWLDRASCRCLGS